MSSFDLQYDKIKMLVNSYVKTLILRKGVRSRGDGGGDN